MDKHDSGGLVVSELGKSLFGLGGKDPYLEDPNTLWLLHWNICKQMARCTTWHWALNRLPSNEFTRESLLDLINAQIRHHQASVPSDAIVKRDVEVFIRTYVPAIAGKSTVIEDTLDCPLVELQLIEDRANKKHFQLRRGAKHSLNNYIFLYALLQFWDQTAPDRETLAFSDIAYRAGSPGNIFKLDEASILERLDQIHVISQGSLSFAETAGVRQVYRSSQVDADGLLQHYYDSESLGI